MPFTSLGLGDDLLAAVADQGYHTPSPIQAQAIPAVLSGRDVMAAAQTGTGKTAGFTLPLLERLRAGKAASNNQVRALVLTPTRELAAQVAESVATYGKNLPLTSTVVFGGVKVNPQMQRLRGGADILVATPGRLLDLYQQNAVKFDHLEILVLDEADRMLDMGFIHDIRKILSKLPPKRQNLMFSATFSPEIRALAKGLVNDPVEIDVSPRNTTTELVTQWIAPVDKQRKAALLTHLIQDNNWFQVLVFSRTKHGANKLAKQLESNGIEAAAIHGNKSQNARTRALADFKNGKIRALVATDIAARGLDIEQLPQVVNVDLPNVPEDYVHRIGRTGRAGATGQAISLVSADEAQQLKDIERLTQQQLERKIVAGFEPGESLPAAGALQPPKRKRPKKPKPGGGNAGGGNAQARNNNGGQQRQARPGNDSNRPGNSQRRRRPSGNRRPQTQQS
ncbi:DEAD/DEAH box helicase [Alcanivorax jadensis T9]|jgi:ATP-dependent RNA helicase RhlE|uniref:ATP-dependent RNA helicase RhlE n=1 Tax=Alcanivorax jadensis T9 TaxID=1177181 RepID=A0ABR4WAS0_9GAMM|nr:DEAD/DEAH box helicase [Alcanivorax jadensis]KGD60500.1 DEAD/DEAH box helicase [Alcanivorax jadensis T9]MBG32311.1 ATP-dependent RNA helicase [Alcanivorax sp.]MBP20738.1 ATP-dependent RNA helicase [Alcanivorax sp.]|tara:strand:+ start:2091 stop:3446 length:1356 start_codon:yes stop_codon:yes gene_type:complete